MANKYLSISTSGAKTLGTIASADLTTALASPPAIGGTTASSATFSALVTTGEADFNFVSNGSVTAQLRIVPTNTYGAYNIGQAVWIDIPTSGPSGIGSGGPGQVAWMAYCSASGQWLNDSLTGDVVYRNAYGKRIIFGIDGNGSSVNSLMQFTTGNISINGILNFASGTTYKVDGSGNGTFNALSAASLNSTPIGSTTASTGKFTTLTASGSLTVNGYATVQNLRTAIATKTAAYTVSSTDGNILCNASSAAFTVTLPSSPVSGEIHVFKKIDSSSNAVTISSNGKNIDGAASVSLGTQYSFYELQYDGSTWWTI